MRTLKIALSIFALIVGAVATAMAGGLFNVPPGAVGLVMAGAGFVAVLGIQPFALSAAVSKVLSSASVLLTSAQVWHASASAAAGPAHPWLWSLVGIAAILMGVLGKGPITHIPPTTEDGPLIPPAKPDITPPK